MERGPHHREMWASVEEGEATNHFNVFYTPAPSALNSAQAGIGNPRSENEAPKSSLVTNLRARIGPEEALKFRVWVQGTGILLSARLDEDPLTGLRCGCSSKGSRC